MRACQQDRLSSFLSYGVGASATHRVRRPTKTCRHRRTGTGERWNGLRPEIIADETLWRAGLSPRRIAGELSEAELDHLRRQLRAATRDAIRNGGVHTGRFMPYRKRGGHCPKCGSELSRDTIGGRTTIWCPVDQPE